MDISKWVVRGGCATVIVVCIVVGFFNVNFYGKHDEETGIALLRLLYEYESIDQVYERTDKIRNICSEDVWSLISPDNEEHFSATWGRIGNFPTKVRVVSTRPGIIVYALDNEFIQPKDLWCFEYRIEHGVFSDVREYKMAALRENKEGGLF